jgi:hypothetical protein
MENTSNNTSGSNLNGSGNGSNNVNPDNRPLNSGSNQSSNFGQLNTFSSASVPPKPASVPPQTPPPAPKPVTPTPTPKPNPVPPAPPTPAPASTFSNQPSAFSNQPKVSAPTGFTGMSTSSAPKPASSSMPVAPITKTTQTTTPPIWKAPQSESPISKVLNEDDSSNKTMTIVSIIILILILLAAGGAYWYSHMNASGTDDTATTTNGSGFPPGATNQPTQPNKPAPQPTTNRPVTPFTASERLKVADYISKNINSLSPVKSSRKFRVTDINFDGPDRAMIEYTDGINTYVAIVTSYIDTSGNVHVTNFTILEK